MKSNIVSGFIIATLLVSTQAFATVAPKTKLTASCRTAIEKAITNLGEGAASIEDVLENNGTTLVVAYSRESEEEMITGEAQVTLKIVKKVSKAKKATTTCKVVSAEILDERAE